ncbi:MAG: 2-hydroxyacyl-CoA dehydratase subunit D [Candidatus Helarchaeota archaeon]
MSVIETLFNAAKKLPNSWITDWKKENPVVGFLCSYVPEEILYAAKILPIRVTPRGHSDSTLADACMSRLNCPFARYLLDTVLSGKLDFLNGIICYNSCDHIRRMFDNWRFRHPPQFYHFLSIPHRSDELAMNWFKGELLKLKDHIESAFNRTITNDDLAAAIRIYNQTREMLSAIYDYRKKEEPPLTGTEVAAIMTAAMSMPKETFNDLLNQLLEELEGKEGIGDLPRLMIVGSLVDNPEYVKIIEDLGSIVVTDSHCFGSKYFWNKVDEQKNPLDALTNRYLMQTPCPRMIDAATGHHTRLEHIKTLIKEFYVDGVIFERMTMCDLWSGEIFMLQKELKELGVPSLILERDYIISGIGQMKTRSQAFLEVLR